MISLDTIGGGGSLLDLLRKSLKEVDLLNVDSVQELNSQLASAQSLPTQLTQQTQTNENGGASNNNTMMSRNFIQHGAEDTKYEKARKATFAASTSLKNQQQGSMVSILGQMAINSITSVQESGEAYTEVQYKRHMQAARNAPRIARLYELQQNAEAMESSAEPLAESRQNMAEAAESSRDVQTNPGEQTIEPTPIPRPAPAPRPTPAPSDTNAGTSDVDTAGASGEAAAEVAAEAAEALFRDVSQEPPAAVVPKAREQVETAIKAVLFNTFS